MNQLTLRIQSMEYKISHYFLVRSSNSYDACEHVEQYLDKNQLITYADLVIKDEEVLQGTSLDFWPMVEKGLDRNHRFAMEMLSHLKEEGVASLDDLLEMQQGYLTKILHTLTHMLDGFIGVDTALYNLLEDSHQISESMRADMKVAPEEYWVIPVRTGKVQQSVLHPAA